MNHYARSLLLAAACLGVSAGSIARAQPSATMPSTTAAAATQPLDAVLPDRLALADEIEAAWVRHDLRWWFPRCIDPAGGFYERFDADGNGVENADKHCIFQSRMTWVAATICLRRPEYREEFEPVVRHGLAYLREHMNSPDGGVWWGITPDGEPLEDGRRHLYNTAFAIYGASAAEQIVPGAGGRELAEQLLHWLEDHGRTEHPGYAEHYAKDGHAILSRDDPAAADNGMAPLQPFYGDKSMNAQIHLLEALTELVKISDDPLALERLRESFDIVSNHLYGEPGFLHLWLGGDLHPLPDLTSFGHNVETTFLLLEAAEVLGHVDEATLAKAAALTDTALRVGWDAEHGALNDAGNLFEVRERRKDWWVQAESLNALLLLADLAARGELPDAGHDAAVYAERFEQQWTFIRDRLLDEDAGGWHWGVDEENHVDRSHDKAGPWKTPYHTTRALLNVTDRLRGGE